MKVEMKHCKLGIYASETKCSVTKGENIVDMPLIIIIPVLLLSILGFNSLSSFFLEEKVLFAFGNAVNFMFSWGYLEVYNTNTFASLYKLLNIMKTIFWILTGLFLIFEVRNNLKNRKYRNSRKKLFNEKGD